MTPRRIRLAVAAYAVLGALALLWGALRGAPDIYHHPAPWLQLSVPQGTLLAVALGLGVGIAVVGTTRALVKHTRWARRLHVEFRHLLTGLRGRDVALLAVCSGVAEEALFRGAMQPAWGLVISSLLFGLVHVGPSRRFLPWTLWATIMGFVFGVMYALSGTLLAPVIAHVVINYENLHFIRTYDPRPPRTDGPPEPTGAGGTGLVSSSARMRSGGRAG